MHLPSRYLLVQSEQWKQYNNVWNLFKVNNKDTRKTWISLSDGIDIIWQTIILCKRRKWSFILDYIHLIRMNYIYAPGRYPFPSCNVNINLLPVIFTQKKDKKNGSVRP